MTPSSNRPISRILLPTDFSAASLVAAEFAARLATPLGASITVLHVLAPANEMIGIVPGATVNEETESERRAALHRFAPVIAVLNGSGAVRVDTAIDVASSPTRAIVKHAISGAFDLIVMSTHGRTAIGRVILGSVAAGVLRDAHCPVLMIRSD